MYYPLFDWLRITLALIVALSHEGVILWSNAGNLAVQVFFALSGWLIGGILLNSKKEDLPRFFFNRVTRIWIPYALAIGLLLGASLLRDPVTPKWLEFVFYKVTFVYNLFGSPQLATYRAEMPLAGTGNHFWSICAEEQFYLLAPLVLLLLPLRYGQSVILWIGLSLLAVSFNHYGAIVLGVLAAVIRQRFAGWHLGRLPVLIFLALLIIFAAVMYFDVVPYVLAAPIFAICVVMTLARPGEKSAWGQFWGGVSYPFYLNHWIGVFIANEIFEPFDLRETPASKITALVLNVLVAAALYLAIDCTVRRYRRTWFSERRGRIAAIAAYILLIVGVTGGMLLMYEPMNFGR